MLGIDAGEYSEYYHVVETSCLENECRTKNTTGMRDERSRSFGKMIPRVQGLLIERLLAFTMN